MWAKEMEMGKTTLRMRLCYGWTLEQALLTPVRRYDDRDDDREDDREEREISD